MLICSEVCSFAVLCFISCYCYWLINSSCFCCPKCTPFIFASFRNYSYQLLYKNSITFPKSLLNKNHKISLIYQNFLYPILETSLTFYLLLINQAAQSVSPKDLFKSVVFKMFILKLFTVQNNLYVVTVCELHLFFLIVVKPFKSV